MEGIVKWYNTRKGYGFIQGDDGKDYFVHNTAMKRGTFLRENDRVSFDPTKTDRGDQAKNIALLQKGSEVSGGDSKGKEEDEEVKESEESYEDEEEEY